MEAGNVLPLGRRRQLLALSEADEPGRRPSRRRPCPWRRPGRTSRARRLRMPRLSCRWRGRARDLPELESAADVYEMTLAWRGQCFDMLGPSLQGGDALGQVGEPVVTCGHGHRP